MHIATLARAAAPPLAFGIASFAGAELGHALTFRDGARAFAVLWPPAGLLLAALALTPSRRWAGLLVAGCLANFASDALVHGKPAGASLGFGLAHAFSATFGAWLLRRSLGPAIRLGRLKDAAALAMASA